MDPKCGQTSNRWSILLMFHFTVTVAWKSLGGWGHDEPFTCTKAVDVNDEVLVFSEQNKETWDEGLVWCEYNFMIGCYRLDKFGPSQANN